jgi:protein SSD1
MTDQVVVQPPPPQKEDKKPATSSASNQNPNKGAQKKTPNRPNNPSQPRRKPSSAANESGSETGGGRKGNDSNSRRTSENRPKSQGSRGGSQKSRIPSQSRPSNPNNGQPGNRQASKSNTSTPAPATGAETSDALSSLKRAIADLKTASPAVQPSPILQTEVISSLPINAPVFQPGMQSWPGPIQNNDQARHRKAASVGTSFNNNPPMGFAPGLGVMMEDSEDQAPYEDELQGDAGFRQQQQSHNRRSLSQSFTAPRFVALAQQNQGEVLGPTGRPQLAPGFLFGASNARRRGSSNGPMGPPIGEDDLGFQFPQQQTRSLDNQSLPRQDDSGGEITGIMAEQVNYRTARNLLSTTQLLYRLPSKSRSKRCNNNNRPFISSSSLPTKSYLSKPLDSPRADRPLIDAFRVPFPSALPAATMSSVLLRIKWANSATSADLVWALTVRPPEFPVDTAADTV